MCRFILAIASAAVLGLAAFLTWPLASTPAQQDRQPPPVVKPSFKGQAAALPITRVVLFTSGVGYFQREGQIDGTMRVDLSFPVNDINDLLKSLVLQDLGGGHVSAVGYDSYDPLSKALKSFALDLSKNPTLAQLLDHGEEPLAP